MQNLLVLLFHLIYCTFPSAGLLSKIQITLKLFSIQFKLSKETVDNPLVHFVYLAKGSRMKAIIKL